MLGAILRALYTSLVPTLPKSPKGQGDTDEESGQWRHQIYKEPKRWQNGSEERTPSGPWFQSFLQSSERPLASVCVSEVVRTLMYKQSITILFRQSYLRSRGGRTMATLPLILCTSQHHTKTKGPKDGGLCPK